MPELGLIHLAGFGITALFLGSLYYINEAFEHTQSPIWFFLALFALITSLIGLTTFLSLPPVRMPRHNILNITIVLGIVASAFAFTAMYSLFYELGGRIGE